MPYAYQDSVDAADVESNHWLLQNLGGLLSKNCYAERLWRRVYPFRPFTNVALHPERLAYPRQWKKPRRIFVNSMSDLFHESLEEQSIVAVLQAMAQAPQHVYQILTKRPERMQAVVERVCEAEHWATLPSNWWMGVSVENATTNNQRVPILLRTRARTLWLSLEPMLSFFLPSLALKRCSHCNLAMITDNPVGYGLERSAVYCGCGFAYQPERQIGWVVVGGESGPRTKARPFHLSWARQVVEHCRRQQVPVFVKQLGSCPVNDLVPPVYGQDKPQYRLKDGHGGDMREWPETLRVREYPQ